MSNPILLPIPKKVRWKEGSFSFSNEVSVYTDILFAEDFGRVYRELKAFTGSDIKMTNADEAEVLFLLNAEYGDEEHDIKVEADGDVSARLAVTQEFKAAPFALVWDYYCHKTNKGVGLEWLDGVKEYEKEVLSKR